MTITNKKEIWYVTCTDEDGNVDHYEEWKWTDKGLVKTRLNRKEYLERLVERSRQRKEGTTHEA